MLKFKKMRENEKKNINMMTTKTGEQEEVGCLGNENNFTKLEELCGDASNVHEKLLNELGIPGRYQVIQIILCKLMVIAVVFPVFNIVFIGYTPPYTCHVTNQTTLMAKYNLLDDTTAWIQSSSCQIALMTNSSGQQETVATLDCIEGYDYSEEKSISMASDWDLVCDKTNLVPLVQTIFTLGVAVSNVLGTSLADRFSRRYLYLFSILVMFCTELAIAFVPNIGFVICLRFLSGICAGGMYIAVVVIAAELVVSRYRQTIGLLHIIWWGICLCMLSALAHLCRDCSWRQFQIMSSLFALPACIGAYFTNDTPAWYYAKGQHKAAERLLDVACKMNGKDRERVLDVFRKGVQLKESFVSKSTDQDNLPKESRYNFLDLFRTRRMLIIYLVNSLAWFTTSFAYFALLLTSSTLGGDRILNFFVMGILDVLSGTVLIFLLMYFGRRPITLVYFCLTFLSFLVSASIIFSNSSEIIAVGYTVSSLIGKFSAASTLSVVFIYTPELFPTTIRSVGMGSCAFFGRVAGMIAPFMLPWYNQVQWGPSVLISALCLLCLIVFPFLPETRGRQLPNTVEEIVAWKRIDKRQTSLCQDGKASENAETETQLV